MHVVKKGKTSGNEEGVHIKQQAKQLSNGVQVGSGPDTYINGENLVMPPPEEDQPKLTCLMQEF